MLGGGLNIRRVCRSRRLRALSALTQERRDKGSRWKRKNREKVEAMAAVRKAIASHQLSKGPCAVCGLSDPVEAHHEDYSKPPDVVWLCTTCHGLRHREINGRSANV